MNQSMNISNLGLREVQAMAYETIKSIARMQQNLNLLEQRIDQLQPEACDGSECDCSESGVSQVETPQTPPPLEGGK